MDNARALKILGATRVIRIPKKRLATFGDTRIPYHLVSGVENLPGRCRLREGNILAERPKILTPDAFKNRFHGFGPRAREFVDWMTESYGDVLRALEYYFKNSLEHTRVLHQDPKTVLENLRKEQEAQETPGSAVLFCPDAGWQLALMKFIVDETQRSFPIHLREMQERDFFNPEAREQKRRRREVEALLQAASRDRSLIKLLGEKLKTYDLFQEYEDSFLALLS